MSKHCLLPILGLLLVSGWVCAAQPTEEEAAKWLDGASQHKKAGEHKLAVPLFEKVLAEAPRLWGEGSTKQAAVLYDLATSYRSLREYAKAEPLFLRSLEIREAKVGKNHILTAEALYGLGVLYESTGKHANAEELWLRSLPIREAKLGKDHLRTGLVVSKLGTLYSQMGQYAKAAPFLVRALEIYDAKHGKDHTETILALGNVGYIYNKLKEYAKAETFYLRQLEILEGKLGKDHPELTQVVRDLGYLYRSTHQYARAETLLSRGIKLHEAKYGADHPLTATALQALAMLYHEAGHYTKAEPVYLRSLKIREARLGNDAATAFSLGNLALLYHYMGQYAKAEPYYLRSLEMREAKQGKDHPDTARALLHLALLHWTKGEHARAEPLCQRSVEIFEAKLGKDHVDTAYALVYLGAICQNMRQYDRAEPCYERSLAIREAKLGKDHPSTAHSLLCLASLCEATGKYDRAGALLRRNLEICQAVHGKDHPHTARAGVLLGFLCGVNQDWQQAVELVQQARPVISRHVSEILPALSEQEQLAFLETKFQRDLHQNLSLGWAAPKEAAAASAEWLLNGKALGHQTLAEQMLLARDARDPQARKLVADLRETRGRLATLTTRLPEPGTEQQHRQHIQEMKAREQDLAQELARVVGRPYRANPWVTLDELRGKLGARAVYVDIARFRVYDFANQKSKGMRYVAWITPSRGKGEVQLIDLGAAKPIDDLVEKARTALLESAKAVSKVGEIEATRELQKPLRALSAKVLHPLLPILKKYPEWIISPDSALWLVPWSALVMPDGKYTLEKHLIRHVVSGRDLVLDLPRAKQGAAFLFADPHYDLNLSTLGHAGERSLDPDGAGGAAPSKLPLVARLPGTALEAEAVRPRLQQWLGQEPRVFLEDEASEPALKAIKQPRVLMFATHGFFLPTQEVDSKDRPGLDLPEAKKGTPLLDVGGQRLENPLLRCGLLLAGCNKRTDARVGGDDGILTGLEILGLDLKGCELVVLSACQTALGDVRSGEGVAGLRQAFQLAGARSVLATLWQVSDRETALLMNSFYGEIAAGRSQAEALRQAQLQRLASRRQQFGEAHPFFWGAFTLTSRGRD